MAKILIIEDEFELAKVLGSYLEKSNFEVCTEHRGDSGLSAWELEQPDLVLLDLNLPGMDGLDVAREIRRKSDTPIIMITARVEETDQLIGLELGADDYITKPFSPRVVVAKVRAVLRRGDTNSGQQDILKVADVEIDTNAYTVVQSGENLDLTRTEFDILVTLAAQPGRAFSRMQLLESTQGAAFEGYERTIDAHIKNLRAKLETDPKNPQYIETVFGVGYRFARQKS